MKTVRQAFGQYPYNTRSFTGVDDLRPLSAPSDVNHVPDDWMTVANLWSGNAYRHFLDAEKAANMAKGFAEEAGYFSLEAQKEDVAASEATLAQVATSDRYGLLHSKLLNGWVTLCGTVRTYLSSTHQPDIEQKVMELRKKCGLIEQFLEVKLSVPEISSRHLR